MKINAIDNDFSLTDDQWKIPYWKINFFIVHKNLTSNLQQI